MYKAPRVKNPDVKNVGVFKIEVFKCAGRPARRRKAEPVEKTKPTKREQMLQQIQKLAVSVRRGPHFAYWIERQSDERVEQELETMKEEMKQKVSETVAGRPLSNTITFYKGEEYLRVRDQIDYYKQQ